METISSTPLEITPASFEIAASQLRDKIAIHQSIANFPDDSTAKVPESTDLSSLVVETSPETGITTHTVITTLDQDLVMLIINDKPAEDGTILLANKTPASENLSSPFVTTLTISATPGKKAYTVTGDDAQNWQKYAEKIVATGIQAVQGRQTSSGT